MPFPQLRRRVTHSRIQFQAPRPHVVENYKAQSLHRGTDAMCRTSRTSWVRAVLISRPRRIGFEAIGKRTVSSKTHDCGTQTFANFGDRPEGAWQQPGEQEEEDECGKLVGLESNTTQSEESQCSTSVCTGTPLDTTLCTRLPGRYTHHTRPTCYRAPHVHQLYYREIKHFLYQ